MTRLWLLVLVSAPIAGVFAVLGWVSAAKFVLILAICLAVIEIAVWAQANLSVRPMSREELDEMFDENIADPMNPKSPFFLDD